MFYFAVSDCQEGFKEIQYEVGRYEVEITSTNGESSVDFRFKNMFIVHLFFIVFILSS